MQTPWKKLYILSFAGALSWLGSALTTFTVILRDKDTVGADGISGYLLVFAVPSILLSPISGLIADKFSSRTVIIPSVFIMGLSSLSLVMNLPHWWTPIALFITACMGNFVGPAWQAAEVSVTAVEDRPRVTGLMQSTSMTGTLFAPALGGLLVSQYGYFWPFVIDAVSFWLLGIIFLAININRKPVAHAEGEKTRAIDGLKFVFADQLIRAIVILVAVLIIALGVINVGEVFLLKDELQASDFIYGLAGTIFAAASIVGSLGSAALKIPQRFHATIVVGSIAVMVVCVGLFSFAWHWGVVLALSAITGLSNSLLNAYAIGTIMRRAPQEKLGRINAAIGAIIQTGSVSGLLIAGQSIKLLGVRNALLVGAIVSAIIVVVFSPAVLKANRQSHPEPAQQSA